MSFPLACALSALFGALACTSPLETSVALGLFAWMLLARFGWHRSALLCVIAGASAFRAEAYLSQYINAHATARTEFGSPQRCALTATVVHSPTLREETLSYFADVSSADCERAAIPAATRVRLYGGPTTLARGDTIEVIGQLGVVRLFRNSDLPSPYPRAARHGAVLSGSALSLQVLAQGNSLSGLIDRARAHVRRRIEDTFSPAAVGMAKALVLGENDLSDEEDTAFKNSGLAHLLAVSGTHLIFAVVSVVEALRQLLLRFPAVAERVDVARIATGCGVFLAIFYADFAGGSGSAWRAAWMLAAGFGAQTIARRVGPDRAVAASIWVGWIADPLAAFDYSFMLSLAATAGLLTFGRRWSAELSRFGHPGVRFAVQATLATVSSMLPCSLILALMAPNISLIGIIANVFAGPFGEVIALPLCLAHALLAPCPPLELGVATVASGALLVVREVAMLSDSLSWIGISVPPPTALQLAAVGLGAVAWTAFRRRRASVLVALVLAIVAAEWWHRSGSQPTDKLRVTFLDVGQGDAALIDLPDGRLMLADGGGFVGSSVDPGARVLLPVLRARRRSHVDLMVLSHPHPDHFGGLVAVAESLPVKEFWDTGQGLAEGALPAYGLLIRALRAQGTSIQFAKQLCGENRPLPGGAIEVLGPCPEFTPGANPNDNSLVLRIRFGRRAVLLTGDAEHEQESVLLRQTRGGSPASPFSSLRADLLKVAHHGSKTSTGREFLAAVAPSFAVISCGMRNRFGHPHPITLGSLDAAGVDYARLDETGSVLWETDGKTLRVSVGEDALAGRRTETLRPTRDP